MLTGRKTDAEEMLQAMCPSHGGVARGGRSPLLAVGLAPLGRDHLGAWNTLLGPCHLHGSVEAGEMHARIGRQSRQSGYKIQPARAPI